MSYLVKQKSLPHIACSSIARWVSPDEAGALTTQHDTTWHGLALPHDDILVNWKTVHVTVTHSTICTQL